MAQTWHEKAEELGARLEMAILANTGAIVRATVGDQIMLRSESEPDVEKAVAFMATQSDKFALHRRWEARGTFRATFKVAD